MGLKDIRDIQLTARTEDAKTPFDLLICTDNGIQFGKLELNNNLLTFSLDQRELP